MLLVAVARAIAEITTADARNILFMFDAFKSETICINKKVCAQESLCHQKIPVVFPVKISIDNIIKIMPLLILWKKI